MNKEQKAEVVEQIVAQLEGAAAIYAVDYRGLSVTQAAELRTNLRQADTSFRVVKNTLSLRAADKAGIEPLKALVEDGPTALAFVAGDPALAAKVLDTFARQSQVIALKGGVLDGRPLGVDELRQLARLPGRDQLNAQLAGVVASPLTGLVRGLGSLLSGIAIALGQVHGQRAAEEPAEAEAAPEPEAKAEAEAEAKAEAEAEAAPEPEAEAVAEEAPAEGADEPAAEVAEVSEQQEETEPEKEAE
jgi:large subunit ribosomal protein L10